MSDREQQLADFTDQVLAHPPDPASQSLSHEEKIILKLRALMPPEKGIDPAFRQRLNARLNQEWETTRRAHRRRHRFGNWRQRWYAVAAVLVMAVVGVGIVLSQAGQDDPANPPLGPRGTVGTAANDSLSLESLLLIGGVLALSLVAAVLIYNWWSHRR